jgi:hypothetical protein
MLVARFTNTLPPVGPIDWGPDMKSSNDSSLDAVRPPVTAGVPVITVAMAILLSIDHVRAQTPDPPTMGPSE